MSNEGTNTKLKKTRILYWDPKTKEDIVADAEIIEADDWETFMPKVKLYLEALGKDAVMFGHLEADNREKKPNYKVRAAVVKFLEKGVLDELVTLYVPSYQAKIGSLRDFNLIFQKDTN